MMNYKIRHNKNRFSLAFSVIICGGRKTEKLRCGHTSNGSHGERLAQLVCELARVLIISGRSMNIAAF